MIQLVVTQLSELIIKNAVDECPDPAAIPTRPKQRGPRSKWPDPSYHDTDLGSLSAPPGLLETQRIGSQRRSKTNEPKPGPKWPSRGSNLTLAILASHPSKPPFLRKKRSNSTRRNLVFALAPNVAQCLPQRLLVWGPVEEERSIIILRCRNRRAASSVGGAFVAKRGFTIVRLLVSFPPLALHSRG